MVRTFLGRCMVSAIVVGLVSVCASCNPLVSQADGAQPGAVKPALQPVRPVANAPVAQPKTAPIAVKAPAPPPKKVDPSDEFFAQGKIPNLKIVLTKKDEQLLRQDQRRYVDCTLIEDGVNTFKKVGVKLKGAAGSFRNLDDRPAFTLNMNRKNGDQRFHGLDKFHLNNSVQDESYLSELLCSSICREAGCPAARVTHARVWLGERDLGFYVFKEGFDSGFLERNFPNPKGNLYDGGFLRDIDQELEKDDGDGPDDLSDLKALVAACREGDPVKRKALLEEKLDINAFLTFQALELMMCHWDGYIQNKNNYRVYFNPQNNKAVFMPHGMDQMFGDTGFSLFHHPGAIVPHALFHDPELRVKYKARVRELLPLFAPAKLNTRIDAAAERIRPVLASIHPDRAKQFDDRTRDWKNRFVARQQNIRDQLRNGPPEPILFKGAEPVVIDEWAPGPDAGDSKVEEVEVQGKPLLAFSTGPSNRCLASFRRKVLLLRGEYKFEGAARVTGVTPIQGEKGVGVGLRVSGGERENSLVGTTQWQTLSHPIVVTEDQREVMLVIEMRATAGKAWFDPATLKLVKTK